MLTSTNASSRALMIMALGSSFGSSFPNRARPTRAAASCARSDETWAASCQAEIPWDRDYHGANCLSPGGTALACSASSLHVS
jgi:hypothetical protein